MTRTPGASSRAARQTAESTAKASSWSRGPRSPTLTYCTPQAAAPAAARAAVPGRLGKSPMATLTGTAAGVSSRMRRITCGKLAPSEPSLGFFTSTMSAPPATAGMDFGLVDHADE